MRTIQQRQRNKEYEFKFSAVVRRCCAGVWLPASRRRPRLGSPGRSAGLSLFLSLSQSLLFWTTTCETRFFVWVSFVFDCLVAHVKTKCPTQHAIPTRSREKTEPNPKKPFSYLFALLSYTQLRRETLLFLKIEQTFSVRVLIPSCPAPPVPRRPNEFSANISLDFFATRDVVGVAWRESAEPAAE